MKIQVLSDLHNEFNEYICTDRSFEADVIVLAGDIGSWINGVEWAANEWKDKQIVYVSGNHEYYMYERSKTLDELRTAGVTNYVQFLENDAAVIDGVRFLGCTLWTDFGYFGEEFKDDYMHYAKHHLNDFSYIDENKKTFTPHDSANIHAASVAWLKAELEKPFNGKTVVVSHHAPSRESAAARWRDDPLTACYASDLDHLLSEKISLWVHGHMHDSSDYMLNGTRVVCNPRGYSRRVGQQENAAFNEDLIIEI